MKNEFLKLAIEAALKAGNILKKYHDCPHEINLKGEVNLVTEVDRASEEAIIDTILSKYSEHSILGEESGKLENKNSSIKWIIDPLDGTTNYAHGFPYFCVSIAVEIDKIVECGVVYYPLLEELFTAAKNEGAFRNNKKIQVSRIKELNRSLLATGFPYDLRHSKENNIDYFNEFIMHVQAVRRAGAAALDLCYVAMGRLDGFWELKLSPWDVAAASLIIKEAGGVITDFDGNEFSIYNPYIVASNGIIHNDILNIIKLVKSKRSLLHN